MPLSAAWKITISVIIIAVVIAGVAVYYYHPGGVSKPKTVKMAFIFPGSVTDTAWNEAGYKGMLAFEKAHPNVKIAWVQGVYDPAQIESQIRSYIQQGYNLIVGLGFQFGEPMAKLAKQYKNVYFLAVAGSPNYIGPQVSVADVRTDQSCFVAGYLASQISKTKSIAFVAGMAVAELTRCEVGLRHGIAYAGLNPNQTLHVLYVGDFHDVKKSKLGTTALIEQYNVDVVKAMGDGCQLGAVSAAKEKHVYAMMSGTYHPEVYPNGTLLYKVWHWEAVYNEFYNDYVNGYLQSHGGREYWLSMNNGGLKLVYNDKIIPSNILQATKQVEQKILNGEVNTGFTPKT